MVSRFGNTLIGPINAEVFNRLQALPLFASYDYIKRNGLMILQADGCTDMTGCIEYFQRIDPDVEHIVTWSDGAGKTVYRKLAGEWRGVADERDDRLRELSVVLRDRMDGLIH